MSNEPINQSRRVFFRQLFSKTANYASGVHEELHGRPQMLLDELAQFPDSILRTIVPVFYHGTRYQLNATSFKIKHADTDDYIEVMRLTGKDCDILELFAQDLTLEQIADQFAKPGSTQYEQIYQRAKTLFLTLARFTVCHPQQSLTDIQNP